MLIAFCGVDGAGKTTQLTALQKRLENLGEIVYTTKQPTDWYRNDERVHDFLCGSLEENSSLLNELALFSATDRLRHWQTEILPNLNKGKIVLTDRYVYTTYAYFLARGITDIEWLKSINKHIMLPDLTFYLDLPADVALQRIIKREGISQKKEEKDFARLNNIRNIFQNQPWGESNDFHVLDGTKDVRELEEEIFNIYITKQKEGI